MQRFKNILFVKSSVEYDQDTLKRAALLAQKNGAVLKVIKAIKHLPDDLTQALELVSVEEVEQQILKDEMENLEKWVKEVVDDSIEVDLEILVGEPFLEIIRSVMKNGHDMVVKTAEGTIGYKEKLLGSTDMHLVRKCPTPVWMIKPGPYREYKQVLAAVAPKRFDKPGDSLSDVIMQLSTSFSVREQSKLHVVHTWKMRGEAAIESRSTLALMYKTDVRNATDRVRIQHKQQLHELLERNPIDAVDHEVHLLKGNVVEEVPRLALEKEVDVIIMGTVGRTGIPGFFIGNNAEDILNQVNCSVLTVKPKGFQSPVTLDSLFT